MKSHEIEMSSRAETVNELEVKIEVKDEFREAIDMNCEETAASNGQPSEFQEAMLPPVPEPNSQLRCRLCAIPDIDMVDIFNPDEMNKNILKKIEYCLPIMVKETDTMPTKVCRLCLAHLELSYQFHKTVAEAERQLLALDRQTFGRHMKIEKNIQTHDLSDCVNIGESVKAIAKVESSDNMSTTGFEKIETTFTTENENVDSESFQLCSVDEIGVSFETITEIENSDNLSVTAFEKVETAYTTKKANVESNSFQPCSVVVFVTESHDANDSDTETRRSGSNDTKHQHIGPFHPGSTSASKIDQQSTCGSEVSKGDGNRSIADEANLANILLILEQSYLCKFCPRTFRTEKSRTRHNEKVHAGEGRHSCQHCEKKFVTEKHRDDHQHTHISPQLSVKRDAVVQAATTNYPCSMCNKSFKSPGVRQRHMQWHADNNWQCKDCGKTFKSARNLRGHCQACKPDQAVKNRSFTRNLKTKQVLSQQKNVHTREEAFSCEYCGKVFSGRKTRNCHRRTHTKKRPFKRLVCDKMFITDSKLKRHSTVHSEERHYRCSLCDKSFKALDAKKKHMASHADGRLWHCDYCKNSFLRKVELRDHLRICDGRHPKKLQ